MCYDISFKVEIRQLHDYFPDLIFDSQTETNFNASVHILGHDYGEHPIIYQNREALFSLCSISPTSFTMLQ